jgi:hypothetical protein
MPRRDIIDHRVSAVLDLDLAEEPVMVTATLTIATPVGAETRAEAMPLTVALLARLPLQLTAVDAANFAACLFHEVLHALSDAGVDRDKSGCPYDAR